MTHLDWEPLAERNPVPGDPFATQALATHLAERAATIDDVVRGLRRIDTGEMQSAAVDELVRLRDELSPELRLLERRFDETAGALRPFCNAMEQAQSMAGDALAQAKEAEAGIRQAQKGLEQMQQENIRPLVDSMTLAAPVAPSEPSTGPDWNRLLDDEQAKMAAARRLLDEAVELWEEAANRCAARIDDAAHDDLKNRSWLQKAAGGIGSFVGGVAEGTGELVEFAVKFTPNRLLYDPKGYLEDATGLAQGLAYGATHPVEFAKAVTNWDMWLDDPARALGQIVPGMALAVATGGAGAAAKGAGAVAKGAGALRRAAKSTDELGRLARSADELAELKRLSRLAADDLLGPATRAEKKVTPLLDDIAREEGAELVGLEHRLKKADSLTDKISRGAAERTDDLALDDLVRLQSEEMKDVLRYTVQSDGQGYIASYETVSAKLEARGFTLEKVKNTWAEPGSPQAGAYRGINSQWSTPDGQSFELQFHTPESFAMKQRTHAMYEEYRAPETSFERKLELEEVMTRMSDEIPVPPGAVW